MTALTTKTVVQTVSLYVGYYIFWVIYYLLNGRILTLHSYISYGEIELLHQCLSKN